MGCSRRQGIHHLGHDLSSSAAFITLLPAQAKDAEASPAGADGDIDAVLEPQRTRRPRSLWSSAPSRLACRAARMLRGSSPVAAMKRSASAPLRPGAPPQPAFVMQHPKPCPARRARPTARSPSRSVRRTPELPELGHGRPGHRSEAECRFGSLVFATARRRPRHRARLPARNTRPRFENRGSREDGHSVAGIHHRDEHFTAAEPCQ